ncbi:glutamate receptor ionotropic, kainate 1-like isoform X1 [Haliotis rufescens]|uniref:glutamate receptor ionotropic, kainate 1-like isoform X1 n=1 Tax=Haliotis rufescens TaxID=6454 RepID=UPI001EB0A1E1|nr:glutamate receptor ionotropic, kainate 1-like isoform X1 [Haliotis rufescens]
MAVYHLVKCHVVTKLRVFLCISIFGLVNATSEAFRLGIIDSSVDTNIFDLVDAPEGFQMTHHNLTNYRHYTYKNIKKAHQELLDTSVDAIMGDYNSVYVAVTKQLKINYYVMSLTPEDQADTKFMYQFFHDARVFSRAVLDLADYYAFDKITVIHDSYEGAVILERVMRKWEVEVRSFRVTDPTSAESDLELRQELKKMRDSYTFTFIVICSKNNTDRVLRQGLTLSMFSSPNKWLLVNMGLEEYDMADFVDSKANLTILRMMMDMNSSACSLGMDNINLRRAILNDGIQYCYSYWEVFQNSSGGVRKRINERRVHGCTGYLEFNGRGRRSEKYLQLMTLQAFKTNQDPQEGHFYDTHLYETKDGRERKITFDPQGTGMWTNIHDKLKDRVATSKSYSKSVRLEGNVFPPRKLRISTKIEPPFVQRNRDTGDFEGHLIDIIKEVSKLLQFEYNVSLVPDGKFGSKKPYGWTGMVRQLLDDEADVALAPFQVTPSRSEVVDFTKPFMTKGTTVVIKKPDETGLKVFQFLSPFTDQVWIAIFFSFLIVSLVLFSVSRVNSDRQQKYTYNLRESFWYIWGTLLRGSLVGAPHAISSRIVASAWWFFCLILISLYTANLAAFLTITNSNVGINSAADLANQDYYEYGTVDGSQIEYFFRHTKMTDYQKMWAHMSALRPQSIVRRVEDGFERVNSGRYAFIWDSPTITHEISGDCNLMQIGHPFDLKGYGIAYTKNAQFGEAITLAILRLIDEGVMYGIERKWWRPQFCPDARASAKTKSLDVENVAGMFLVLAGGVGISGMLCFVKFCISRPRMKKTKTATYHDDMDKDESIVNDVYDRNTEIQVYANHSGTNGRGEAYVS